MAAPLSEAVDAAMLLAPAGLSDWLVVLPLMIPVVTGALLVLLWRRLSRQRAVAIAGLAALLVSDLLLLWKVLGSGPAVMYMGAWRPPFGIVFAADTLGVTLATTSALIALLVAIHSGAEVNTHERRHGFYPFIMLLMAGVTGAFLTGDLFNLYVWFEVLLISSMGLLVLGSEKPQIDGALKYGLLNLVATTLFLIATAYLYGTLGALNMADIALKARAAPAGPMITIAALFLLAFGMKAAAFPLNFWLPASYHVPSAGVSALFAGLLTKVGVYALLKILVLLLAPQAAALTPALVFVAGTTMLVGGIGALAQSDLRRLLGWLVIAGIGNMLAGLALGSAAALTGSVFYAVHSMLVMSGLYLAAGVVERLCGSGDLRRVGGLSVSHPGFAAAFLVLALAVAGLPPFSGFWPKAMLVEAALAAGDGGLALIILATGLLTSIAVVRVFLFAFWRPAPEGQDTGEALSAGERACRLMPVAVLTAMVVAIGLYPVPLQDLAARSAAGLLDAPAYARAVLGDAR